MKKKFFAIITALLVLAMSTSTVFAAISPTAENATILADAVESQDGAIEVLEQEKLAEALEFVDELVAMFSTTVDAGETPQGAVPAGSPIADVITQYAEQVAAATPDVEVEDVVVVPEVKAAFDFVPSEDVKTELEAKGSVQVSFAVDVTADASVVILHDNGTEYEVIIPDAVKDGEVIGTFTSFSPIVIVELTTETADTAASEGETAPKTGEVVSLVALATVLCGAGATVCGKKSKKN